MKEKEEREDWMAKYEVILTPHHHRAAPDHLSVQKGMNPDPGNCHYKPVAVHIPLTEREREHNITA